MGKGSSSGGQFPVIWGQFLWFLCNFCFEIQYLERLGSELAQGRVAGRCSDLSLGYFEFMLLLPCEYRHVHEQQQGCATLPLLSIGETEAQWMVPQGDARPVPFPVSSRPNWASWLLFCGAGGRGARCSCPAKRCCSQKKCDKKPQFGPCSCSSSVTFARGRAAAAEQKRTELASSSAARGSVREDDALHLESGAPFQPFLGVLGPPALLGTQ